ncbi:MAG TPA: hypothetical protein DF818_15610 [Bacteroidales bacterium]|nr:hypothetical protein [Bacteroidales bacterium]
MVCQWLFALLSGKYTTIYLNNNDSNNRTPHMQLKADNSNNPSANSLPVILVVEDDTGSQFYMEVILSREFRPIIAGNNREVFDVLEKEKVAMILMDISLRESISGLDITRLLRSDSRYKELPIVAVTVHVFHADKQRSLEAGCNEYLSKPVKKGTLLMIINKYLGPDNYPVTHPMSPSKVFCNGRKHWLLRQTPHTCHP